MKSFKDFLSIRENSRMDIARMSIGKTSLTEKEEVQLSMLYRIIKNLISESGTMFVAMLNKISDGDPIMQEMAAKINLGNLRQAGNRDLKGIKDGDMKIEATSGMDVLTGALGKTSFTTKQEEELSNVFSLVQMAIQKEPQLMMTYLKRLATDDDTKEMVENLDLPVLKIASRKINTKNAPEEIDSDSMS
jgi:hypothetical protein